MVRIWHAPYVSLHVSNPYEEASLIAGMTLQMIKKKQSDSFHKQISLLKKSCIICIFNVMTKSVCEKKLKTQNINLWNWIFKIDYIQQKEFIWLLKPIFMIL